MSNYPPGVTGNEPQIAGPSSEREFTEERECPDCEELKAVDVEEVRYGYSSVMEYWTCPDCGHEHEEDITDKYEEGPDPDGDRFREDW